MSREAEVSITPKQHESAVNNFKFQRNQIFERLDSEEVPSKDNLREQILYKHIDELINPPVLDPTLIALGLMDVWHRK